MAPKNYELITWLRSRISHKKKVFFSDICHRSQLVQRFRITFLFFLRINFKNRGTYDKQTFVIWLAYILSTNSPHSHWKIIYLLLNFQYFESIHCKHRAVLVLTRKYLFIKIIGMFSPILSPKFGIINHWLVTRSHCTYEKFQ